ncbi:MAG: hypothetical protein MI806_10195 [Minwuiales bacterium]|nr:hypothetical protein [Minwuiales bacterium]
MSEHMPPSESGSPSGMSVRQARGIEFSIVGLCVIALLLIFQPFSLTLFGIGAGLVVLAGLSFNLVPLCRPGRPISSVVKAGLVVLLVLLIVVLLGIGSAHLYVLYLSSR